MSFRVITWRCSNIQEHQDLLQSHHRCACDNNPNPRGLLANQHANHYWLDSQYAAPQKVDTERWKTDGK